MTDILAALTGGDRRSIGKSNQVTAQVLAHLEWFGQLFEGLRSEDPVLRMRCADVIEKVTRDRPELLQPLKRRLLHEVALIDQQEVRWHLAPLLARLDLSSQERIEAAAILTAFLQDRSAIVKTFALQALADLAGQEPALKSEILEQIRRQVETGSPAVKNRGRKLLTMLERNP